MSNNEEDPNLPFMAGTVSYDIDLGGRTFRLRSDMTAPGMVEIREKGGKAEYKHVSYLMQLAQVFASVAEFNNRTINVFGLGVAEVEGDGDEEGDEWPKEGLEDED